MIEAILYLITDNNLVIKKTIPNFTSYIECVSYVDSIKTYDNDNVYLTLDKKKYKLWIEYCN